MFKWDCCLHREQNGRWLSYHGVQQITACPRVAKAVYAHNPLQMQSKTTSTWFKLKSCTVTIYHQRFGTLHMRSPPLANLVLHTLPHDLLSYERRYREAALRFTWKFEQVMQKKTLSALGGLQLQHKPNAISMPCMNDSTSRRTYPVTTLKCCLPLKRKEHELLYQKTTLLAAQGFPSAFSHVRTDQAWTSIHRS